MALRPVFKGHFSLLLLGPAVGRASRLNPILLLLLLVRRGGGCRGGFATPADKAEGEKEYGNPGGKAIHHRLNPGLEIEGSDREIVPVGFTEEIDGLPVAAEDLAAAAVMASHHVVPDTRSEPCGRCRRPGRPGCRRTRPGSPGESRTWRRPGPGRVYLEFGVRPGEEAGRAWPVLPVVDHRHPLVPVAGVGVGSDVVEGAPVYEGGTGKASPRTPPAGWCTGLCSRCRRRCRRWSAGVELERGTGRLVDDSAHRLVVGDVTGHGCRFPSRCRCMRRRSATGRSG